MPNKAASSAPWHDFASSPRVARLINQGAPFMQGAFPREGRWRMSLGRIAKLARSMLLFVLLAFLAATCCAQYTRTPLRNLTGTVTDAGEEPLRGAVVQIEALDTLVIQSYETNERGEYHFRNLRSDADYSIWATFRGNRSKTHGIGKFDHKLDRDIPITVVLEK